MLVNINIIKLIINLIFPLFNLTVLRPKIYSVRSLVNLINIYKFTKKTLARRSSFDRFSTSLIICCFHTHTGLYSICYFKYLLYHLELKYFLLVSAIFSLKTEHVWWIKCYSNSENVNALKEHGGRTIIDSDIQLLSFL